VKTLKPRLAPHAPSTATGWMSDQQRGNRHQRGYGYAWEKLRASVLERDTGLCQPCLRNAHVTAASQVDHITPKAQGGTDHPSNLEAICEPCHKAKTARESGSIAL
jgi:5-methylcytosine-specific restriction protein A